MNLKNVYSMPSTNMNMLQTVAIGLGELKDEMVFVGGAVAELYASDPAASDIRPTLDVDCVIGLSTRLEFYRLEENLRARGFANDTSQGAPICRWIYKDIKVDVMPTDEDILGFSNKWYNDGIINKMRLFHILLYNKHLTSRNNRTGNGLETSELLCSALFYHCFK